MAFCIDASVWISAGDASEPHYAASEALLGHIKRTESLVIVPTLLVAEVAGVLRRTRGSSELATRFVGDLTSLSFVHFVPLDHSLAGLSAKLASNHALRGADAVYAAVASRFQCNLISLDKEHLQRLTGVVSTFTPADMLAQLTSATGPNTPNP